MVDSVSKSEVVKDGDRKSWLEFIPTLFILMLAGLLPLIFLPLNIASFYATKSTFFSLLVLLSLFTWLVCKLKDNYFKLPFNLLSLSLVLVPVLYVVSTVFSTNFNISFFGSSFDSTLNILLTFLLVGLVSILFQNIKYTRLLYVITTASLFVVMLFHVIKLPLVSFLPTFNFFFTQTSNTVGKWYDLAIFAGLGLIICMMAIEIMKLKKNTKIFLYTLSILSLLLLALINFRELWFVIVICSLFFFVYTFTINRTAKVNKIPILSLSIFLISFVFILAGFRISPIIGNYLGIDFVEARPSLGVTVEVIKESLMKKPVTGYGPSRFDVAWTENKPDIVNISDFWNSDFKFGYGLLPSLLVNVGILGFLPWVMFFVFFLWAGFRTMFLKKDDSESKYFLTSSFVIALYLWILNFIYIPNTVTLSFAALFTGIFIASLYREDFLSYKKINIVSNPRVGFMYIFVLIILLISSITAGYIVVSKFVGDMYYQKANISVSANNLTQATSDIVTALQFEQNDLYFRALTDISNIQLSSILNNENLSTEDKTAAFQQTLNTSVQSAQAAIAYDSYNYNNYLNLGAVYEALLPLNIEGVYEQAQQNYLLAQEKNKTNPAIRLALARLEINKQDYAQARIFIDEALQLKPNYTEAVYLLAQIDVLEGKLKEAITKVEQATYITPNDPLVYFQLGVLKYQDTQYESAVTAFENAVIRNPYYSNAKYFLGLSYYQVNRKADAILQFEDLVMLNPDNADVKNVLEQMKNGTFTIESSVENPDEVSELPISEDNEE